MRGSTMQAPLLVLGLLSLMTPLPCAQDQRYQDLVNRFLEEYNTKSGSENLFRLSILNLPSGENNDPAIPQPLSFTIKETVCPSTENHNPYECDFKENGVVKECIGAIVLDSPKPSDDISCDGVPEGDVDTEAGDFLSLIPQSTSPNSKSGAREPEKSKKRFSRGLGKKWKKLRNSIKKRFKNFKIGYSIPFQG